MALEEKTVQANWSISGKEEIVQVLNWEEAPGDDEILYLVQYKNGQRETLPLAAFVGF